MTTATKTLTRYYFDPTAATPLYERCPDSQWTARHSAWCANIAAIRSNPDYGCGRGSYYLSPVIPSQLPWGHVTFDKRRACYRPGCLAIAPAPVWTDGTACLYDGQRIAWHVPNFCRGGSDYRYGTVERMSEAYPELPADQVYVRAENGLVIVSIKVIA